MADEQQHYVAGKNARGGAGRSSCHGATSAKDGDFGAGYYYSSSANLFGAASSGSGPNPEPVHRSSSAPTAIPDWQKIYGASYRMHGEQQQNNEGIRFHFNTHCHAQGEDVDDEEEGEMIPPHEYIARKLASSRISSFSVCEGAGRTLKGRDLSRVRNAILTKTGFLE